MNPCPPELPLLNCLANVPTDRYVELFNLAMGGLTLVPFLLALTVVIYASRTNPR